MSLSVNKNGIISTELHSEFIVNTFDTNYYVEPDESMWIRIFHHNNPANARFASTNTFTSQVYLDTDRWFNVALCNQLSDSWELMVKQKTTSTATETKYRWIQYKNPMTAVFGDVDVADVSINSSSGYTVLSNYGGIYYKNSNTYLCVNNANSSNWMGAVGSWNAWNNGIPGWGSTAVTTGYMDLYLRIDRTKVDLDKSSFGKNYVQCKEFIEL